MSAYWTPAGFLCLINHAAEFKYELSRVNLATR